MYHREVLIQDIKRSEEDITEEKCWAENGGQLVKKKTWRPRGNIAELRLEDLVAMVNVGSYTMEAHGRQQRWKRASQKLFGKKSSAHDAMDA